MKPNLLLAAILSAATLLPLGAQAVTYINETFEDDTIGVAPSDAAQKKVSQVTVEAGSGLIGTDNMAHFNDASSSVTGNLEYNVGGSAVGNMFIQFDLLNNLPGNTGSAAQPVIFGVGPWSTATGIQLGANGSRSFGAEFYQTGSSSTLKLRTNGAVALNATYNMAALQTVKIWVNDDDTSTLSYTRPDNTSAATLGANSFVVWINDALLAGEADSGFGLNATNTVGNATIGRLGFDSTTAAVTDFSIDNLLVTDVTAVPEPSAAALLSSGAILLGWLLRRKARC